MRIPEIYLCSMGCGRLRAATVTDSTTSLEDLCPPCLQEWDRQRAEDTRQEILALVRTLADTDERGTHLTRLLQLVVGWPELAAELNVRLQVVAACH